MAKTIAAAAAVVLGIASAAQAAYIIDSTEHLVNMTKTAGGSTFTNTLLLNVDRTAAAQFANYKEVRFDVELTSRVADANFGFAWNSDLATGGNYHGMGETWTTAGWKNTITYKYDTDTNLKTAASNWAAGQGVWFQFAAESNWPTYAGTNTYKVTKVYLESPVPEPTSMALVGLPALGLLARRRKA